MGPWPWPPCPPCSYATDTALTLLPNLLSLVAIAVHQDLLQLVFTCSVPHVPAHYHTLPLSCACSLSHFTTVMCLAQYHTLPLSCAWLYLLTLTVMLGFPPTHTPSHYFQWCRRGGWGSGGWSNLHIIFDSNTPVST